jgi:hypothetical protein
MQGRGIRAAHSVAVTVQHTDTKIYRPGPQLALGSILTPVVPTLIGAAIALDTTSAIPVWLPLLLLIWIPLLPLMWLALKSVRVDGHGIAVARPWQRWREIPWSEIRSAEARLGSLRLFSETGERISFAPALLRDGARLERSLLMRLPSQALSGVLRQRAQQLIIGDVYPTPTGEITGILRARPRARWRAAGALLSLAGVAGAVAGAWQLAGPIAISVVALGVVIAIMGLGTQLWLAQTVFANEHGIEVALPFRARTRSMRWREVELIEATHAERLLRLRSYRRLLCPGPGLLSPADRNAMRAFIHEYCLQRKVPLVRRRWLI